MIWRDKTFEMRYRIGRLQLYQPDVTEPDEDYSTEAAFVGEVREYNNRATRHGGDRTSAYGKRKKQITDQGDTAIEQVGVLLWFPSDQAIEFMEMIEKDGWSYQQ